MTIRNGPARCWRLAVILSAGGLVLASAWFADAQAPKPAAPKPAAAAAIKVSNCRIKLVDQVTLACHRAGVLAFVEPHEGDAVRADQQVASLDDAVARAQYEAAAMDAENDVEVRFQKKAAELKETEYRKAKQSNDAVAGVYTEIELEQFRLEADKAKLQVEQAEHKQALNLIKRDEMAAQLNAQHVKSPIDGVVTKVYKKKGEAVREGEPVLELVNTERVRVEGYLHISDTVHVKPGAAVQVRLDIPDVDLEVEQMIFPGRVIFVDVKVDPVTGDVRLWAEVVNKEGLLRDGLQATMTIGK